jgi:hypothetical protein
MTIGIGGQRRGRVLGGLLLMVAAQQALAQDTQPVKPEGGTPTSAPTTSAPTTSAPTTPPAAVAAPEGPTGIAQFTLHGDHAFSADLSDAPGSVSIDRATAELVMHFPAGERSRLDIDLGAEASFYHFDNATGFAAGFTKPWDDVQIYNLQVTYNHQSTPQWAWYVGGAVSSSLEQGADFGKSVTGGLFAGADYTFSPKFSAGLGLYIRSRLEDNGVVLPLWSLNWQIAEKWKLVSHTSIGVTGFTLSYDPSEAWTFLLDASYENREFRLDDSGAAPEGVGRDWRIPVALGAAWHASKQLTISGSLGVVAHQEYTLLNSDGDKLSQINTKPAALASINLVLSF